MSLLPSKVVKMSGAGNTFVLIDARRQSPWHQFEKGLSKTRRELAIQVCDPVFGVKCDGALFIEDAPDGFDFSWDFYNSDGSGAEMCGNAARCAARFCQEYIISAQTKKIKFKTGAGLVTAEILPTNLICVTMPEAFWVQRKIHLKTKSSSTEEFDLVNTGVPHLVQKIQSLSEKAGLQDMAREARHHLDLQPAGANVTFYVESSDTAKIQAVTFERGVEDYTLACGTGAVAAAMVHADIKNISDVQVEMPGGSMGIRFEKNNSHPLMTGEAIIVGEFQYNTEVFK